MFFFFCVLIFLILIFSDVVPTIVAQCQSVEEIKKKFRNNVNMELVLFCCCCCCLFDFRFVVGPFPKLCSHSVLRFSMLLLVTLSQVLKIFRQIKTLLRIAEVQPNLIAQLGMTREQIEGLLEKAEKEKEICRMTPEEKTEQDRKLWTKWLTAYRYDQI